CRRENVALTVVGPEAPLAAGIVDAFRAAGLRIFGPTRAAAQLESSKHFAKSFMQRHGLPTARYRSFESAREARAYVGAEEAPVVTPKVHARVMREIIQPAVLGMAADGHPYVGFLYAGLMIDAAGNPKTLEFNCRLGDPETQPILMRLKSDLLDLIEPALAGSLDRAETEWDR